MDMLSIVYGPVCSLVFSLVSGWGLVAETTVFLAWCTGVIFCLGFPAATFWYLARVPRCLQKDQNTVEKRDGDIFTPAGKARRNIKFLGGMVNYYTDESWFFRHLQLLCLFLLSLDLQVFAIGISDMAQIVSTVVGIVPCLGLILLLIRRRRYLRRYRWMGWAKIAILLQVVLGYVVKCAGYFMITNESRLAIICISWLWAGMYVATPIFTMAGFVYCIFADAMYDAKEEKNILEMAEGTVLSGKVNPLAQHDEQMASIINGEIEDVKENIGETSFYDEAIEEIVWSQPKSFPQEDEHMGGTNGLWKEFFDSNTERNYYYNATTGETTWNYPKDYDREIKSTCKRHKHVSDRKGSIATKRHKRQITSSSEIGRRYLKGLGYEDNYVNDTKVEKRILPIGWEALKTEDGAIYYRRPDGTTTWEPP